MWIAKDNDGSVNLFRTKPVITIGKRYVVDVVNPSNAKFQLDERMFPNLKFEDGPMEIEIIIKKA